MIDFWRTVGMAGPLKHMPLSLCEPPSVQIEDIIPIAVLGITPSGKPTNQLSMRHQSSQRWWYYPDMTGDEVLAFKNFQCFKGESARRVEACFHSAFAHPATPHDAEERQSCEHRVSIYLLKN